MEEVSLSQIKVADPFWSPRQTLVREVVIPYQEKILNDEIPGIEKSHALANFRIAAGLEEGDYYGMVFQDSDVAKWLEGVAYSLAAAPDPELEARADAVIDIIGKAQQEDGYLNTYFTVKEPEHRWQNLLECHELYCAGHMMEAAAAYYEATGKQTLLNIMERMADHIDARFGPGKQTGIPGHEEIEIGLLRLYEVTEKESYLRLAQYFIEERGKNPHFFEEEEARRDWFHFAMHANDTKYNQSFAPVREQKTAEGHSVRAVYLYTAMAELAKQTKDEGLFKACRALWDNLTKRRMYVTGGIGSTVEGEAFTIDYDLPNDTAYAETCASIGLVFFARKMLALKPDSCYADVMERALYNGILSGMQLDGRRFFYVNPLEVNPGISGELYGCRHVLPERPEWYACACCPPNVVRLLMSLGRYAWGCEGNTIFSHLFLGGEAVFRQAHIAVESSYPWEVKISYRVTPKEEGGRFTLAVRIPDYAGGTVIMLGKEQLSEQEHKKDGYVYLERDWKAGDLVTVTFDLPVRRVRCSTRVRSNIGKTVLMRGPLVYCFEEADNGGRLQELRIPREAPVKPGTVSDHVLGELVTLELQGVRECLDGPLYTEEKPSKEAVTMRAIPYYAWGNRGSGQMSVWMQENESTK